MVGHDKQLQIHKKRHKPFTYKIISHIMNHFIIEEFEMTFHDFTLHGCIEFGAMGGVRLKIRTLLFITIFEFISLLSLPL